MGDMEPWIRINSKPCAFYMCERMGDQLKNASNQTDAKTPV